MIGMTIGLLSLLFAMVFIIAFIRGAHDDDDNAIGEEAANPTVIQEERDRAA